MNTHCIERPILANPRIQQDHLYRPDLCAVYAAQQSKLPAVLSPETLDSYVDVLFQYPYLETVSTLQPFVFNPAQCLDEKRLVRLEHLIERVPHYLLQECMSQSLLPSYSFHVVPQGGDPQTLLQMMNQIPNCVPIGEKERVAQSIQQDIDYGACIKLFGVDNEGDPQMYTRYYITLHHTGKPMLQIDAVEGGNESYWTKVQQWIDAGRGKELVFSIAASLYVADQLGISDIVLGDFESDEIGEMIGCREVRVYEKSVLHRKIGLLPRLTDDQEQVISEGVFVNRLGSDTFERLLHLDYVNEVQAVLRNPPPEPSSQQRWMTTPSKQREIALYRHAIAELKNYLT
ncbi:hypothetical protein HZB02_06175 [Candidatus Woesearchaeota archaeon]|nr:hypothetical protein [Candidatus Woesearchaeota archaeon]